MFGQGYTISTFAGGGLPVGVPATSQARREGLTVDALVRRLVHEHKTAARALSEEAGGQPDAGEESPLQLAANIILDSMRSVPSEVMSTMPSDGASQHDHYIYGWPKREV